MSRMVTLRLKDPVYRMFRAMADTAEPVAVEFH